MPSPVSAQEQRGDLLSVVFGAFALVFAFGIPWVGVAVGALACVFAIRSLVHPPVGWKLLELLSGLLLGLVAVIGGTIMWSLGASLGDL